MQASNTCSVDALTSVNGGSSAAVDDEKTSPANKSQTDKAQAHNAQPPTAQQAQPTAKPALSTATPAAKPPLSATAAVPQAVGAVRAAAAQPALPATLPNTRFKAVSAARA